MKKRSLLGTIGDFVLGRGFYIVLGLCVAAIGLSGYYFFTSLGLLSQDSTTVSATEVIVVAEKPSVSPNPTVSVSPSVSPSDTTTSTQEIAEETIGSLSQEEAVEEVVGEEVIADEVLSTAEEEAIISTSSATVFTWPVKGLLLADYSLEVLAYDETMGDWRTHSAIDIAATLGTEVLATSAGTVLSIEKDLLLGTTLTIDHGEGLKSIYANLSPTPAVAVGDTVKTGTIIGSVGSTAVAESAMAPHLHFEMELDGISIDPVSYLPVTQP